MARVKATGSADVGEVIARSRSSPRRRANHNLHPTFEDPIQRFINVFQVDSYVRPHRHGAGTFELFAVLQGRVAVLLFDDGGEVVDRAVAVAGAAPVIEIDGASWHTLVALEPDTMTLEVKPGPYRPLEEKDFAPWSPHEATAGARSMLAAWRALAAAPPDGGARDA